MDETPLNNVLIRSLRSVGTALGLKDNSPFVSANDGIAIQSDGKTLITVTSNDIVILEESFQNKLINTQSMETTPDINQRLDSFLNGISDSLVRLNHVGINYFSDSMQEEAQRIKALSVSSDIPLFEEQSSEPDERWLFLGSIEDWQNPLVEMVLSNESKRSEMPWKPQFQIDIDTTLTIEEIKLLTDKHLGNGFIKWQLDIPDYGIVLAMGHIGKVDGVNISLGIGTDKRGTENHRRNELKPLI